MDSDGQLWTRQTGIDWLFHGENTGSIPVGDANKINNLGEPAEPKGGPDVKR